MSDDEDVPIYCVSLYRLPPFLILLSLYRRIFKGVWLSAARIGVHPLYGEYDHIRVYLGLPDEMEADVVRHELNHADVTFEDVVDDIYWVQWVSPFYLAGGFALAGVLPKDGLLGGLAVGATLFAPLWGIHRAKTMLEDAVNDDIVWEQYDYGRDIPGWVDTVLDVADNWLHTIAMLGDTVFLVCSCTPGILLQSVRRAVRGETR